MVVFFLSVGGDLGQILAQRISASIKFLACPVNLIEAGFRCTCSVPQMKRDSQYLELKPFSWQSFRMLEMRIFRSTILKYAAKTTRAVCGFPAKCFTSNGNARQRYAETKKTRTPLAQMISDYHKQPLWRLGCYYSRNDDQACGRREILTPCQVRLGKPASNIAWSDLLADKCKAICFRKFPIPSSSS